MTQLPWWRWCMVLTFALATTFIQMDAQAQDDTLVVTGQSITNSLASGESAVWRLPARDGAMFSFIVEQVNGDLDPILSIEDTNGSVLISNDDYSSDTLDAAIEGFTVPRNGTYIVRISAYGDTSGDYRLTALPGYAAISLHEEFNEDRDWQLITSSEGDDAQVNLADSQLHIEVEGIQQTARVTATNLETPDHFFAQLMVNNVSGRNGWQVGMTYRQRGNNSYYIYLVDHRGYWRAAVVEDGEERVLSDWNPHPAIVAGTTSFELSIFVKDDRHEFLYDGQLIGDVRDDTLLEGGRIGFVADTVNALGSRTSILLDDLIVTVPMVNGTQAIPVQQLVVTSSGNMVRELERRNVIPAGGAQTLSLEETSARFTNAGVSRYAVASNVTFSNVVVGATIDWPFTERLNGCGLVVRDAGDEDTYVVGFIDSNGGVALSQREGDAFTETVFRDDIDLPTNSSYHILLIAIDDEVRLFVEGEYVGSIESINADGGIGQAVINYDPGDTTCQFDNLWVWSW